MQQNVSTRLPSHESTLNEWLRIYLFQCHNYCNKVTQKNNCSQSSMGEIGSTETGSFTLTETQIAIFKIQS